MADRVPTLPQPPIVWGPSEVIEWISGAFPSRGQGPSRRARAIEGFTLRVWSNSLRAGRDRVVAAIESLGYAQEGAATMPPLVFSKGVRTIVVRFHPALLRESLTVAVKFAPHAPPSTATKIVDALAEEFPLGKVSMTEARTAAKAVQREPPRSAAKLRKDWRAPAKK